MAAVDASDLVSVRQNRRRPLSGDHFSRQSPDPVAGDRGTWHLPARLDRQAAGGRIPDSCVLYRAVAGVGDAAAHDRLPLLLPAIGHDRHAGAGLCADAGRARAASLGVMGVCRGLVAWICRDAADLGRDARDIDADLSAADDVPELDLSELEAEPGNAAPVDAVPVVMRPVDRQWLPRGITAIMMTCAAPRFCFLARRLPLRGLWRDGGARDARGRAGLRRGGARRLG